MEFHLMGFDSLRNCNVEKVDIRRMNERVELI